MKITLAPQWKGEEPLTFGSYSALLRWIVETTWNAGGAQRPTLTTLYLGRMNADGTLHPNTLYNVNRNLRHSLTEPDLKAVMRLLGRYKAVAHYFTEIEPGWKVVSTIPYMDNSVVEVQEDKRGNRRRVTVKPPSGDACF